jgi:hypothetical protein
MVRFTPPGPSSPPFRPLLLALPPVSEMVSRIGEGKRLGCRQSLSVQLVRPYVSALGRFGLLVGRCSCHARSLPLLRGPPVRGAQVADDVRSGCATGEEHVPLLNVAGEAVRSVAVQLGR